MQQLILGSGTATWWVTEPDCFLFVYRVTRRLGKKFTQFLEQVAKTVAEPKTAKISTSKLNLEDLNMNIIQKP
jgi:hypothetical protein